MAQMRLRPIIPATLIAVALAGCAPEPDQPQPAAPTVNIDAPEFASDATSAAAIFFPDGADTAVIAGAEPAAQLSAAEYAVREGLPFVDSVAAATTLGAKELVAFGTDAAGFDGTVTPGDVTAQSLEPFQQLEAVAQQDTAKSLDVTALATVESGLTATATARAAGATVLALPVGDPRFSPASAAAAQKGNVVALGPAFGSPEEFADRTQLAANGELPGGGGLVFPGRRMIALYGHPSGPALGVMGEQSPAEAAQRVTELAQEYQQLTQYPVVPAFEIIATVASADAGPDGDYSNESDPAELVPYVDAITQAGGYAVLDLQPGRARLLDQAKMYEELLSRPNVGLALDPEWKIGPDEVPMTNIGHVEAEEVNEVADWLAELTRAKKLPQKAFILHQFQLQMIRDRETLNLNHPELAFILHADGHGPAGDKMETWNVMRQGLDPRFFMAWKNFIDEDRPMFTPAQTFDVAPRPWFVSYQ